MSKQSLQLIEDLQAEVADLRAKLAAAETLAAEAVQADETAHAVARRNQATLIERQSRQIIDLRAQVARLESQLDIRVDAMADAIEADERADAAEDALAKALGRGEDKVKIRIDDDETRAIWETAQQARVESVAGLRAKLVSAERADKQFREQALVERVALERERSSLVREVAEAVTRAERAEAAAGQMRLFLEEIREAVHSVSGDEAHGGVQEGLLKARRPRVVVCPLRPAQAEGAEARAGGGDARRVASVPGAASGAREGALSSTPARQDSDTSARGCPESARECCGLWASTEARVMLGLWGDMHRAWAPPRLQPATGCGLVVLALPREATSRLLAALATDAGRGYASPEEVQKWENYQDDAAAQLRILLPRVARLEKVAEAARGCLVRRTATARWIQIEPDDASDLADAIGDLDAPTGERGGGA